MNFLFPIILIITSIGLFFGYIDPNYKGTGATGDYTTMGIIPLRAELAKYQDIAKSSNSIVSERDNLVKKKNTISNDDQARLERLLPSNIDNIRLIIEISQIAANRGLVAKNISVSSNAKPATAAIGPNDSLYGTLTMNFTVNASYSNFLNFLSDLENNLRLVDITNITFGSSDSGFYDFSVTLNTYWLK